MLATSASNQRIRPASTGLHRERVHVQVERARQEVHAEVAARARPQQVLNLLVRLADRQRRVDVAP